MNVFYTTIDKPEWVTAQEQKGFTIIHCATRPLYGDATENSWNMPWIRGRHYAALDPNGTDFETYRRLNEQNDASEIRWADLNKAYATGIAFYEQYYSGNDRVDFRAEKFRQHVTEKGLEVMNGFETIDPA